METHRHRNTLFAELVEKGFLLGMQRALLCLLPSGSKQCLSNWPQMLNMLERGCRGGRATLISAWLFYIPVGRRSMAGIKGQGRKGREAKILLWESPLNKSQLWKTLLLLGHSWRQGQRRTGSHTRELLHPRGLWRTGDCKGGPPDDRYNGE